MEKMSFAFMWKHYCVGHYLASKRQKILCGALPSRRERKRFEKFLKKWFEQVKYEFFKNLIHDVQLIEKQVRSIEPDRGSLKFFKRTSIDRKLDWINQKSRKKHLFRKIT